MKIHIEIECETILEFHSHLLSIYTESIVYSRKISEESEQFDPGIEPYDLNDINDNKHFDDNNCYGTHEVKMIEE